MCARRASIEESLLSFQTEFNLNPSQPLFKITYKSSPIWPISSSVSDHKKITRIAILDSSFNPPTNAHYHLIVRSVTNIFFQNDKPIIIQTPEGRQQIKEQGLEFFDSCLLLYATKNADKILSSSDANHVDRLLMMETLASHIQSTAPSDTHFTALKNLAVGVVTHPRFIDKAHGILSLLLSLSNSSFGFSDNISRQFSLYFIMGYDTVIRLFNPQYYTNMREELAPFFETNYIICANREGYDGEEAEEQFYQNEIVREIIGIEGEKIIRIKLDNEIAKISSTRVRDIVRNELRVKNKESTKEQNKVQSDLLKLCPEPIVEFVIQKGLYRKEQ
ncbi:Nucleotidylyl transferase [Rhizophagus irregularis]|uniref:Nucleotidylyl transferase n=2 Tax=Rhizophagus irregularis TaxID=588596 RepID=A0A2I1DRD6_9GLOM|nr:Nucleotidylyl transferase [Rhizophagus irregularis]PKY12409.1 Nucleotidylyl transferase [Rhizophagus irregularis]